MNRVSLTIATSLLAASSAFAQQGDVALDSDLAAGEEELRRYAVEIILFSYDASVSAGTEIFEPDPPPTATDGDPIDGYAFDSGRIDGRIDAPIDERMDETGAASLANPAGLDPAMSSDDTSAKIPEYGDTLPMPNVDGPDGILEDVPLVDIVSVDGIEFERIPQDELTLVDAHERLIRVDAYRPVLWTGWKQVALPEDSTPELRLRRLGPVPLDFSGTLKLYLSRFLHLVVDIELEAAAETTVFADEPARFEDRFDRRSRDRYDLGFGYRRETPPPVVRYRIAEDRIVSSGELRYFDHPRFGLLAKLTRIEEEEAEQVIEAEPLPDAADTTDDLLPR